MSWIKIGRRSVARFIVQARNASIDKFVQRGDTLYTKSLVERHLCFLPGTLPLSPLCATSLGHLDQSATCILTRVYDQPSLSS